FADAQFKNYTGASDFHGLKDDRTVDPIQLQSPDTSGVASMSDETTDDTPHNDSLGHVRTIAPALESHRGVVVTATNKDDVNTLGFAVGAGSVGVSVSGTVNVITADTNAFIAEGARVNQDTSGTVNAGQGVLVAAASSY